MSITLLSIKNSLKYLRTSATDGLSGVPKLTSNTPVFAMLILLYALRGHKFIK